MNRSEHNSTPMPPVTDADDDDFPLYLDDDDDVDAALLAPSIATPPVGVRKQPIPKPAIPDPEALIEGRALRLVDSSVALLQERVDSGTVPTSTLVRVAEAAHKISGADQRRTARAQGARPGFSVNFLYPGNPDPPADMPGSTTLTVRLTHPRDERVIEGEAVQLIQED